MTWRLAGWRIDYAHRFGGAPVCMWVDARVHDQAHVEELAIRFHGVIVRVFEEFYEAEKESDDKSRS